MHIPIRTLHNDTITSQTAFLRAPRKRGIGIPIMPPQQTQHIIMTFRLLKPTMCRHLTFKVIAFLYELDRNTALLRCICCIFAVHGEEHHTRTACMHRHIIKSVTLKEKQPLLHRRAASRRCNIKHESPITIARVGQLLNMSVPRIKNRIYNRNAVASRSVAQCSPAIPPMPPLRPLMPHFTDGKIVTKYCGSSFWFFVECVEEKQLAIGVARTHAAREEGSALEQSAFCCACVCVCVNVCLSTFPSEMQHVRRGVLREPLA